MLVNDAIGAAICGCGDKARLMAAFSAAADRVELGRPGWFAGISWLGYIPGRVTCKQSQNLLSYVLYQLTPQNSSQFRTPRIVLFIYVFQSTL